MKRRYETDRDDMTEGDKAYIRNLVSISGPPGAQTYQKGKYYKMSRGKLWYYDGIEWCLSTRRVSEVPGVRDV